MQTRLKTTLYTARPSPYNIFMFLNKKDPAVQGFCEAEKITRKHAKTFYFTSLFLPKDKRLASYSIYVVCRLSDEAVDSDITDKKEALEKVRRDVAKAYSLDPLSSSILCAFRFTIRRYQIPKKYFDELLEGMAMDLNKTRYQNFEDLYPYCYRVAGVIGLMMIKVFGHESLLAEKYAVDLGIALQLTNILRDIKEDYGLGRIYLPQDELAKAQVSEQDIRNGLVNKNFEKMMVQQIERARSYYVQASHGIEFITNKRCRFVGFLIMTLYAEILKKIEQNKFDVFSKQARIPTPEKIFSLVRLTKRFFSSSFSL